VRLDALWSSWSVIRVLAVRDMKVKYKQSVLGAPWLILQPAGVLAAMTVVFAGVTTVDSGDVPYWLFALVGLTVWTFVQLSLAATTQAIVLNADLIRRVPCPRLAFVIAGLLSSLVAPAVILVASLVGLLIEGEGLKPQIAVLPVLVVWLIIMIGGVGLVLSSMMVRYRDTFALIPFVLQAGLFLTPVGYSTESAPPHIQTLLAINPLTGFLDVWRWAVLGSSVDGVAVVISLAWTVVLAVFGWRVFTRREVTFADDL
jgi:ABC-type polysaccharide/polyol phosphate export permease